jgi:hypothetical protein
MNMIIQKFFGKASSDSQETRFGYKKLPIEEIRAHLHTALSDCKDMRTQRVIYKINIASTPADLWLLRSDLHQCIAQVHSQSVAAERINGLLDTFEGWLPASQLVRI